jgi:hypothetical protein
MNKETAAALEASIEKWRKNAEIDNIEKATTAPHDCPLCTLFYKKMCDGCPVNADGRHSHCEYTPYEFAEEAYRKENLDGFKQAAVNEVIFLESLRDK